MPTSGSEEAWWSRYPTGKATRPEHGIATSKQRGEMATTWWSGRLVALLDSYGLGGRMQRGRRYARQGQLVSFEVQPGAVVAQVQGTRSVPYAVSVTTAQLTAGQWEQVHDAMQTRIAFVAQLLAGHVPPELEAVFDAAGVPLLPLRWRDLHASCSCPDLAVPCKHIAAVLYVFADRLDDDPWLLLRWRGLERDEVLARLRASAGSDTTTADGPPPVAPWWPLVPETPLPAGDGRPETFELTGTTATLDRLGPLDVQVHGRSVPELLLDAYRALADEP